MLEQNIDIINQIMDKYQINEKDKSFIWQTIYPIFIYPEFQRRMNIQEFAHHDQISLGYHIISDAVYTFKIAKKRNLPTNQTKTAIIIAMFHDLYEFPWQNSKQTKKAFINSHALVHPLEAAINASTWYPDYFINEERAKIIIDGVIHHMFPWPVRAMDNLPTNLNNEEKFQKLNSRIKNLIIASSLRGKIGHLSLSHSKFIEGQIMSHADKVISLVKDISLNGLKACITGKNKKIENHSRKR